MDLLVIVAIVCAAWMALALTVAALCRAASRVDAELDRLGADVLRARERGQDRWRPAAL
jgi:hypothetical protein